MKIQYEKNNAPRLGTEDKVDELLVGLIYATSNFVALKIAASNGNLGKIKEIETNLQDSFHLAKSRFHQILAEHADNQGNTHN
jgi:hypothetical protein